MSLRLALIRFNVFVTTSSWRPSKTTLSSAGGCKLNSSVTSLDNELLGTNWAQDNLPCGGILHEFKFYVKDRLVCRLFRFGGEYAPTECGQGIPLVLKCRAVLGLWIFGMNPQQNAEGGRSWLIIDGFVMFWISLYRVVLLRSDWESL